MTEETKAFIDGTNSLVMFRNSGLKGFVLVLPLEGLFVEHLPIRLDVGFELSQVVGDSVSLGEEDIVNEVVCVKDVSVSILDFLGKPGDISIVVIGSPVVLGDQIREFSVQIIKQLLDGFNELLQVALGLEMNFGIVQDEVGPI